MDSCLNKMSVPLLAVFFVFLNFLPLSEAQNTTGNPCNSLRVDCQMGDCVVDPTVPILNYQCKCKDGWSKLIDFPTFPCGFPHCQLNFSCENSSAPASTWAPPPAPSILPIDLCSITNLCGTLGQCVPIPPAGLQPISAFKCVCNPGSSNLLNMTGGYCLPDFCVQESCKNLGITLSPPAASTPSNSNGGSSNSNGDTRYRSVSSGSRTAVFAVVVMWIGLQLLGE